ncbi:anti-anti-sigma factor [Saccharothrix tamanrassetensis]|uniref:Anti-sigma factor antagonist n=1 Tax=Saccharothrix tamanrassetensis TaxID=1051531 RepID=A0A841CDW1_9PSEU|nr:anti-sigma factor antagonist [Saccharothrix tamanrassetensis]MBB5954347.1 anti-anti-sigma factor [Saccharothrix tamanrassetensis]
MSFRAKSTTDDGVVTIRLIGDLDSRSAPVLNELIAEIDAQPVRRLVLLVDELAYLSSAGLRCLVFAHQKMGRGVDIVLVGVRPEVAETIRLTGFDRSVIMQDPVET